MNCKRYFYISLIGMIISVFILQNQQWLQHFDTTSYMILTTLLSWIVFVPLWIGIKKYYDAKIAQSTQDTKNNTLLIIRLLVYIIPLCLLVDFISLLLQLI